MASGLLLKLKLEKGGEVKGESEVEGYKGWIELETYSWALTNPGNLGRHSGQHSCGSEVALTMRTCAASPVIMQAAATGDPIKEFKVAR